MLMASREQLHLSTHVARDHLPLLDRRLPPLLTRPFCQQCGRSDDDFLCCRRTTRMCVEALRSRFWQEARAGISTKQYVRDLVAQRNRVLHEVNTAPLRSYVEQTGGAPEPSQIQQMRRVAVALWNSLAVMADTEDTAEPRGEDETQRQASERDVSHGLQEGQR
jgi:hypothetical protein